jgi:erythromycin esterase-like protein
VNAEKYYSSMMGFDNESWNIRDTHMMETLGSLMKFHGSTAKGIVWVHNTHIGDVRATDMKRAGMINIGELARSEYGEDDVFLIGFGSYRGNVIAGDAWGSPMEIMDVPPAGDSSIENALHEKCNENCYSFLMKKQINYLTSVLATVRLVRFIILIASNWVIMCQQL